MQWQTKKEKLNKWKQFTTIASYVTKEAEVGITIATHLNGTLKDTEVVRL
jgi:hypothetical protein